MLQTRWSKSHEMKYLETKFLKQSRPHHSDQLQLSWAWAWAGLSPPEKVKCRLKHFLFEFLCFWQVSFQLIWFRLYLDVWYSWEIFQTDINFDWQLKIQNNMFSPVLVHKYPGWCRCRGRRRRASLPSTIESSKACCRRVISNFFTDTCHVSF